MDIKQIRQLVKEYGSVVLVEEGHSPLVVRALRETEELPQEVPIAARWPKSRPAAQAQDAVLERLNKEILALREQIAQEETQSEGSR